LFFGGKIVTGVIETPPPQGIVREWEWEWEFTGNGKHATIPGPFANAIPRMAKGMTTAGYICHISGKNVPLQHTKMFCLTCDVICHILSEKRHILAPPVQKFFEQEEM